MSWLTFWKNYPLSVLHMCLLRESNRFFWFALWKLSLSNQTRRCNMTASRVWVKTIEFVARSTFNCTIATATGLSEPALGHVKTCANLSWIVLSSTRSHRLCKPGIYETFPVHDRPFAIAVWTTKFRILSYQLIFHISTRSCSWCIWNPDIRSLVMMKKSMKLIILMKFERSIFNCSNDER